MAHVNNKLAVTTSHAHLILPHGDKDFGATITNQGVFRRNPNCFIKYRNSSASITLAFEDLDNIVGTGPEHLDRNGKWLTIPTHPNRTALFGCIEVAFL